MAKFQLMVFYMNICFYIFYKYNVNYLKYFKCTLVRYIVYIKYILIVPLRFIIFNKVRANVIFSFKHVLFNY